MGQSRPKPCGCSSNAFLSGDVCGAAHGRRTLLSASALPGPCPEGSVGAGLPSPRRSDTARLCTPRSADRDRPGSPVSASVSPALRGQGPLLRRVLGERGAGTHMTAGGAPSTFASAFDVLRRRDEFLGAAGGGLRIRQPVSEPQFCRHCVAGSYRDKKRL